MTADKPLRVLHVAPTISASDGLSLAVIGMLGALDDQTDVSVHLLAGQYRGVTLHPAVTRRPAGSVDILPVFQPLGGRLGHNVAYPPAFSRSLARHARSADVVHIHGLWLYPTIVGCPLLRWLKKPYIISSHGSLMSEALRRRPLKKRFALVLGERKNIDAAATIIATSQPELDQLGAIGVTAPTTIIPLTIDPDAMDFFSRDRTTLDTFQARPARTVLAVSRFHSRKRLVELVRAFADIADEFPNWRLRIVGPDDEGGYRNEVQLAVRRSGFAERIDVEPALQGQGLWTAYRDSDLFVLASMFENFGLVIGEALAAGVPVIATKGAPWPQLRTQQCGWWIDPSLESLRLALRESMSTPAEQLWHMGQRGARVVDADYSFAALGVRLAELYRRVVG